MCDIINKRTRKIWTKEHVEFIKENYPKFGAEYCASQLDRTISSIKTRAENLGFKSEKFWTSEEDNWLINNFSNNTAEYCSKYLGRSISAISHRVMKLNIVKFNWIKIIAGEKYNSITPIEIIGSSKNGETIWKVKCDCGFIWNLRSNCIKKRKTCKNCKRKNSYKGGKYLSGSEFGSIKQGRKRKTRTLEFSLTIQYIENIFEKQKFLCALSGIPIKFNSTIHDGNGQIIYGNASVDRIDSSKGYVEGNIQIIHKNINQAKWNTSQEDFIEMCHKVSSYNK